MIERLNISSTVTLNDGNEMPLLGFGTGSLHGTEAKQAVTWALEAGYRHIDTAWWYRNEVEIGQAIAESGLPRDDIFVTTKIWPTQLNDPEKAIKGSLDRLGLKHVDLYLIHRQIGAGKRTWQAMEGIKSDSFAHSIGVSNFGQKKLQRFMDFAETPPAVNQVRCSALYFPESMYGFCQSNGVKMVGYSPLTRGNMDQVAGLDEDAARMEKSSAQLLLRWAIEKGIPVLPRTDSKKYIEENADIFDFQLDALSSDYLSTVNQTKPRGLERLKLLL